METKQQNINQNTKEQTIKKIEICVPIYNTITGEWFTSFMKLLMHVMKKYQIGITIEQDQPIDRVRNNIIKKAILKKPNYIFFLDSDNVIEPHQFDILVQNAEELNADLVSGLYFMKVPPYYPVLRKYENDTFKTIKNIKFGKIINIDGCGMGCALIKTSVFNEIEYPWFKFTTEQWGETEIPIGEDLYFCKNMLKLNKTMYANTLIISQHIGGMVNQFNYLNYFELINQLDMEETKIKEQISEFLKETYDEVDKKFIAGSNLLKKEWLEKNPKTEEEIKDFYKLTKNYIYDQSFWHMTSRREFDLNIFNQLCQKYPNYEERKNIKILDYGCGIAQLSLMLAKVGFNITIADLDSYTLDFAIMRFKNENIKFNIWQLDLKNINETFDYIMCFDVFEHLTLNQLIETTNKLNKLKKENTKYLIDYHFTDYETHPMHMEFTIEHKKILEEFLNGKI